MGPPLFNTTAPHTYRIYLATYPCISHALSVHGNKLKNRIFFSKWAFFLKSADYQIIWEKILSFCKKNPQDCSQCIHMPLITYFLYSYVSWWWWMLHFPDDGEGGYYKSWLQIQNGASKNSKMSDLPWKIPLIASFYIVKVK